MKRKEQNTTRTKTKARIKQQDRRKTQARKKQLPLRQRLCPAKAGTICNFSHHACNMHKVLSSILLSHACMHECNCNRHLQQVACLHCASLFLTLACSQSSLVGTRMRACQPASSCEPARIRCNAGRTYAKVLPVPVLACATRSLPSKASGMQIACTCVGVAKPFFRRAWSSLGSSCRSSNAIAITARQRLLRDTMRYVADCTELATGNRLGLFKSKTSQTLEQSAIALSFQYDQPGNRYVVEVHVIL